MRVVAFYDMNSKDYIVGAKEIYLPYFNIYGIVYDTATKCILQYQYQLLPSPQKNKTHFLAFNCILKLYDVMFALI